MAQGLPRRYKLIHNGRELSQGLLSESGKYDAFQILVKNFDMGVEGAIDPDEVEVVDMMEKKNDGNIDWSGVFLRTRVLFLLNVQLL